MKNALQIAWVIVFFMLASRTNLVLAQGRYNLRLTPESIDCINGKKVATVEIQATSADSTFVMGNGNIRIGFNRNQFKNNPVIKTRHNFSSGDYKTITSVLARGADSSIFTLNIEYRGEFGNGTIVTNAWIKIASVELSDTTTNTTKCYDLRLIKSEPSTVITRAYAAATADDPGRTLTASITQGVFTNIVNECPSAASKPVVSLTGDATVNPNQVTPLTIKLISGDMPYTVVLSPGGITLTDLMQTTATQNVSPSTSTTYQIQSVSNACGTGTASSEFNKATITVSPPENCPPAKCAFFTAKIVR